MGPGAPAADGAHLSPRIGGWLDGGPAAVEPSGQMGIGSIIAGVVALLMTIGGAFLFWLPFAGSVLSFLAPLVALAGIVTGGLAISRARRDGESSGTGIGGLVVSIVAFIPAVLVALTCGLCNALCTGSYVNSMGRDAGVRSAAPSKPQGNNQPSSPSPSPPPPGDWADGGAPSEPEEPHATGGGSAAAGDAAAGESSNGNDDGARPSGSGQKGSETTEGDRAPQGSQGPGGGAGP